MRVHLRLLDGLLKYGVAAIIFLVLLYPKFPLVRLEGQAVSVRIEDFVIAAVFAIWLLGSFKLKDFWKSNVNKAILLFLGVSLISVFAGAFLMETIGLKVGLLHWARRIEYISAFFMGISAIKKREDVYFFMKLLMIVVVLAFFYGLGQRYYNIPIITTQNAEYARGVALQWREGAHLVSTFAGHYDLASFLILVFPVLYLLLFAKNEILKKFIFDMHPVITRVIIFAVVLMGLWLLSQTASRISLASYLGSSTLALILAGKKKFIPVLLILSFVFASMSMNLVDRYLNLLNVYAEELPEELTTPEPVPVVEDRSTSIRLNVEWPRAIRALTKNPITGTGYSSITLATDNDYLRMLGETGLLGFVSFWTAFGFIIAGLVKGFPRPKTPEALYVIGIFAAISGVLVNMVFIDLLEASKFAITFWLCLGFAFSVTKIYAEKNNK